MSPYREQRLREDRCDQVVSVAVLVAIFGLLLILPRSLFWFWMIPLGVFWVRWNVVRLRRDKRSLAAEFASERWGGASDSDGAQGRISIPQVPQDRAVIGQQPHSPIQLTHIIRR